LKRKVKGFTLIELIVVMGILAVLAGVLVPNMINSIRKAKVNTANANAKAIFNASQTIAQNYEFKRETGINGTICSDLSGSVDDTLESEFTTKLKKYFDEADRVAWKIYIDNYIVKTVVSAERPSDIYVGKYPKPYNLDDILSHKRPVSNYTDGDLATLAIEYDSMTP
jgi:type IV pilus assembly protein PilA